MQTYSKQADAEITRILTEWPEWNQRYGAMVSQAQFWAAKADAERVRCAHLQRSPRDWVPEFFARATPKQILDLMLEIKDQLQSRRNYLNDVPMCDLSEVLTEIEDAIFEYEQSTEREAEARGEAVEFRADCRRDKELLK